MPLSVETGRQAIVERAELVRVEPMTDDHFTFKLSICKDCNAEDGTYRVVFSHDDPLSQAEVAAVHCEVLLDREALEFEETSEGYGRELTRQLFTNDALTQRFVRVEHEAQSKGRFIRLSVCIEPSAAELHGLRWELLRHPETDVVLASSERLLFSRFMLSTDPRPIELPSRSSLSVLIAVLARGGARPQVRKSSNFRFRSHQLVSPGNSMTVPSFRTSLLRFSGRVASAMLVALTFASTPARAQREPVSGMADLHLHQFNHMGFGGRLIWGDNRGPLDKSLDWCTKLHGPLGTNGLLEGMEIFGMGFGPGHKVGGNPQFDGWPRWDTISHQQVHEDWLLRAHQGGLNLVVMLAGNNEHLCKLNEVLPGVMALKGYGNDPLPASCSDMDNIRVQIDAAKAMDRQTAWYQIVYSPDEAREAIRNGRLAVVLGAEPDYLFGCGVTANCSKKDVQAGVRELQDMGIRHVFPLHVVNNGFGGSAIYSVFGVLPSPELLVPGKWDCSKQGFEEQCNERGLTWLGKDLLDELMQAGIMIDIDHASFRAKLGYLEMAEAARYPLISSHTGFVDISKGDRRSEGNLRQQELRRILGLGGLIAPIMVQGNTDKTISYDDKVAHKCGTTAESFFQAFAYLSDFPGYEGYPIALGSDLNGLAGVPKPRFGPDGCYNGTDKATWMQYPFTSAAGAKMGKQRIGNRDFDINTDGLTNVGMIPDFVASLEAMNVPRSELKPLFSSAEGYIQAWERAVAAQSNIGGLRMPLRDKEPARTSANWEDARKWCASQGLRLARADEVCRDGKPINGKPPGDVWMVVGDAPNRWVSIGTQNPDRLCRTHEDVSGVAPAWGTDRGPEPVTSQPTALACVSYTRLEHDKANPPNWNAAKAYCTTRSMNLCTRSQVCPGGAGTEPVYVRPGGDVWLATGDGANSWISIGTAMNKRVCRTHTEVTGFLPAWGTTEGPQPFTHQPTALLCCPGDKLPR